MSCCGRVQFPNFLLAATVHQPVVCIPTPWEAGVYASSRIPKVGLIAVDFTGSLKMVTLQDWP
jgi:hypothetical protein